ncbi:hypothetical protein [Capsulimonas corticalis]|uniref:hypothetical protein n=1 Tax=Capsulimonas corticalis TaxID=2219043 RepID=UPI000E65A45F|nr:hypothetical protein [Capsulimonas corticalis]
MRHPSLHGNDLRQGSLKSSNPALNTILANRERRAIPHWTDSVSVAITKSAVSPMARTAPK